MSCQSAACRLRLLGASPGLEKSDLMRHSLALAPGEFLLTKLFTTLRPFAGSRSAKIAANRSFALPPTSDCARVLMATISRVVSVAVRVPWAACLLGSLGAELKASLADLCKLGEGQTSLRVRNDPMAEPSKSFRFDQYARSRSRPECPLFAHLRRLSDVSNRR
jgi:hypothetical protein